MDSFIRSKEDSEFKIKEPVIKIRDIIIDKAFDEERSLYNLRNAEIRKCVFAGAKDGESVLKESRNIKVMDCKFSLRYPFWHVRNYTLRNVELDEFARAPLWYAENGYIQKCRVDSIRCLRESKYIHIKDSTIYSPEFGWKCDTVEIDASTIESEYMLFESKNINIKYLNFKGKYSFQYVENMIIEDSYLDTKNALWHCKDVVIRNSVIQGENLGWFSENLTLVSCKIIGTQPFCYCKNLNLYDCEMENTDLSFEYSEVYAILYGHVESIRNPKSGTIIVDTVGEVIFDDDAVMETNAEVKVRKIRKTIRRSY